MSAARIAPWHVTAVTWGAAPYFARFAAGAAVGCELALMQAAGVWDVLAWVLLPCRFDAAIAPLRGRLDDTVPRFLDQAAARAARVQDDPRPVWAPRFAYRPMPEEGEVEATARALLRKPLRSDLVERLADYPFWDSAWVTAGVRAPAHAGAARRHAGPSLWVAVEAIRPSVEAIRPSVESNPAPATTIAAGAAIPWEPVVAAVR